MSLDVDRWRPEVKRCFGICFMTTLLSHNTQSMFFPCAKPCFFPGGLAREERGAPPSLDKRLPWHNTLHYNIPLPGRELADVWNEALVFKLVCGSGNADVTEAAPATYKERNLVE